MNIDNFGIGDSLIVAGMGILIVFSVLAIIIAYLYLQSKVFLTLENKKKKLKQNEAPKQPVIVATEEVAQQNDDEIVAVISACIYTMLQEDDSVDSDAEFVIRKIEKLKWSK